MTLQETELCDSIIQGLNKFYTPAQEEYSDISQFFSDPDNYLDITYRTEESHNSNILYTAPISTGGMVYTTIDKACQELIKVNAYTEALALCQSFLDKIESIKENLAKEDLQNVNWSEDEIKKSILNIMKMRDDYTSLRKSTIARYSALVNK
jgi:hypothetical protein